LRCIRKKQYESEYYYGDDISIEKDGSEYYVPPQVPHLNQIEPILSVSHVVSSFKQSLEDLGNTVLPTRWTTNQETPVKENSDLPV
jgi:hypothetical protein